jgi:Zn-dependent protease
MLLSFIISFPLFLSALVVHEYAHGWVANKFGDPTAKHFGRLTFNPLAHIDPVGTIIVPVSLILMGSPQVFGWAKPVPINFSSLRNPKKDMFWVGIAGPAANILMAVLLALLLRIPFIANVFMARGLISYMATINIILGIFNMLPIPPLDGSRILFSILPYGLAFRFMKLEPVGIFILLGFLWLGMMDKFVWPAVLFCTRLLGI